MAKRVIAKTSETEQPKAKLTIDKFKTAQTLLAEFRALDKVGEQVKTRAEKLLNDRNKIQLHSSQTQFFNELFKGILDQLTKHFTAITQLDRNAKITINDTNYEVSSSEDRFDKTVEIHLKQQKKNENLPELITIKTKASRENPIYIQLRDTQESQHKATHWLEDKSTVIVDPKGERSILQVENQRTGSKGALVDPLETDTKRVLSEDDIEFINPFKLENLISKGYEV